MRALLLVLALATAAEAAPSITEMFDKLPPDPDASTQGPGPLFAFNPEAPVASPTVDHPNLAFSQFEFALRWSVVGKAREGTASWMAADVDVWMPLTSEADDVPGRKADGFMHAMALVDDGRWVMWHTGWTSFRKQVRPTWVTTLGAVPERVGAGAEDVVTLAKQTLADPKLLAASFDDRKDVVLFGSERKERWSGPKDVRAKLLTWKLAFTVADGVQAGLTSSKTMAWVAANVDARKAGAPTAKATRYRASMLYEKLDGVWKLVVLQFSSVPRE